MTRERAKKLRILIEKAAESLSDETALYGIELFPAWTVGSAFAVGDRVRHGGKLYKCVQPHTSQADWVPDAVPALWTEIAKPGEIPEWKQPTGAQDAYNKGDIVRHNGFVWESTADANVWEPGVYGWTKKGDDNG